MTVNKKISLLRKEMEENNIDVYIIPSNDPHMSEYPPAHWLSRKWITEFTGSLGTLVVTKNHSGLWVDSRYFIQGEKELKGTEIKLEKQKGVGSPCHYDWILENIKSGSVVGIDGEVLTMGSYEHYTPLFKEKGIKLETSKNLIDKIWIEDRPSKPMTEFFIHDEKFAGKSANDKINRLRKILKENNSNSIFINGLDEICWLFNLRAKDVSYNPVGLGFAYIDMKRTILFTYESKVEKIKPYLLEQGISIENYDKVNYFLSELSNEKISLDPNKVCYNYSSILNDTNKIIKINSPVAMMKAIKNNAEIEGTIEAMKKDGIALTKFFMWLEENIKNNLSEYELGKKLSEFRAKQDNYFGDSFGSIIGYKGNGAIVHYSAPEEKSSIVNPEGLLLVDSGGQYFEGTTDITRTISLGNITDKEKKCYSLVLKGHINLHLTKFPYGKSGSDLELLARVPLWNEGLNFGHGVGHGVGAFMNVHEGPYSFAVNEIARKIPLEENMLLSNEPGYYETNEFGIRIENIVIVNKSVKNEYGQFMEFEELTYFPINTELVDKKYLSETEIEWLNSYNKKVYDKLKGRLNEEEKTWLKNKCKAI